MGDQNLKEWLADSIKNEHIPFFERGKIAIGGKLGGGASGQVYEAQLEMGTPATIVAVKIFKNPLERKVDPKTQDDLIKEIKFLRTVCFHPNILSFYGVSRDPETEAYMLILEHADGGSLRNYLRNKRLTGTEKIRLAKEIASGVSCLHDNGIIHRDLSSANILVHKDHIKIADLGLSKKVVPKPIGPVNSASVVQGHLQYVDPQCYKEIGYVRGPKSDVYSVGIVFWELTSGRIMFSNLGDSQVIASLITGVREEPIEGTPSEFVELYTKCWDTDPEKRPDIHQAYETLNRIEWITVDEEGIPSGT